MLPTRVSIVDVGPRDGLQNEKTAVPTADKIALIERLIAAGIRHIEATSFVSPTWVPQMADAVDVLAGLQRRAGVTYAALVPNMKGMTAALAAHIGAGERAGTVDEIIVFGAASEAFSRKNINCSVAESIERFAPVCAAARAHGIRVGGSISTALGCPYQGAVTPAAVAHVAQLMKDIGVERISVADTIGVGTPRATQTVMQAVLAIYDVATVSGHFHDTYGQALANVYACLELGIARFDASVGGLGGCPYAVGATGNVATEDVVYLMEGLGIETGIDLAALADTGQWISGRLGKSAASRAGNALASKKLAENRAA